nr:MAG TPA: hypothetical protein [Caudoviricetes sp.]
MRLEAEALGSALRNVVALPTDRVRARGGSAR